MSECVECGSYDCCEECGSYECCVECGSYECCVEYENKCEYCYIKANPQLDITINKNCSKCNIQLRKYHCVRIYGTNPRDICMGCFYIEQEEEEDN